MRLASFSSIFEVMYVRIYFCPNLSDVTSLEEPEPVPELAPAGLAVNVKPTVVELFAYVTGVLINSTVTTTVIILSSFSKSVVASVTL